MALVVQAKIVMQDVCKQEKSMPPKRDIPLLKYDEEAVAALTACREYLEEAKEFLESRREELPDPSDIAEARFPGSAIVKARHQGDDKFNRERPFIAAVIKDRDAQAEQRSERYFDPWYFVTMVLMELPGGRFHFDRSKHGRYFYLAYVGPEAKEGRYSLLRIIANASSSADTRQGRRKDAHYDYRRATLKQTAKKSIRQSGQKTRSSSRGREEAIQFAIELFKRQLKGRGKKTPPVLRLNP
jgi:hypothetical protein